MRRKDAHNKPLAELVEQPQLRLLEADEGSSLVKIEGIGSRGDVVNKNGRYYSTEVLKRAVEAAQTAVAEGSFTGELEHPESGLGSLERTAIRYTRLWMEGSDVRFEGVVLNTPAGRILRELMEGGVKIGVSTRGTGRVRWTTEDDFMPNVALVEELQLYGMDAVKMPSNEAGMAKLKESIEGLEEPHKEDESMNLEELRAQYPDLVKQIEESAASAARAEVEAQLTDLTAQVKDLQAQLDTSKASVTESEELRNSLRKALLAVGLITESEIAPAEKEELLESANSRVKELEARLAETQQALGNAVRKIELAEAREAVRAKFDELTKDNEFAAFITESIDLNEFTTVEGVEKEVARLTKLAEAVRKSASVKDEFPGKGELLESRKVEAEQDDEFAHMRRLAGLE